MAWDGHTLDTVEDPPALDRADSIHKADAVGRVFCFPHSHRYRAAASKQASVEKDAEGKCFCFTCSNSSLIAAGKQAVA